MGRSRASALMAREDVKGKPRGGASHACPGCGGRTEVIDTRRNDDGVGVRRVRRCVAPTKRKCQPFVTKEEVAVDV